MSLLYTLVFNSVLIFEHVLQTHFYKSKMQKRIFAIVESYPSCLIYIQWNKISRYNVAYWFAYENVIQKLAARIWLGEKKPLQKVQYPLTFSLIWMMIEKLNRCENRKKTNFGEKRQFELFAWHYILCKSFLFLSIRNFTYNLSSSSSSQHIYIYIIHRIRII